MAAALPPHHVLVLRYTRTKTDVSMTGPGWQRDGASKEMGLDSALWGAGARGPQGPAGTSTVTGYQPHHM